MDFGKVIGQPKDIDTDKNKILQEEEWRKRRRKRRRRRFQDIGKMKGNFYSESYRPISKYQW
jgi:hypothetical protein